MSDFKPDPTNYVMKGNNKNSHDSTMASKYQSDEDALVALGIDWRDDEALKRLSRMKLARIVASCPATPASLPVIRELLDRLEGRPTQKIEQKLEVNSRHVAVELSTLDIMRELDRLAGKTPQHIVSGIKKLERADDSSTIVIDNQ